MSRRRWCRSAGSGVSLRSERTASVHDAKDPSFFGYRGCRRGPRPADHTPSRSWRLPDLFFLSGHSDGRDRLGTRRPPLAGCALRTVLRVGGGGPVGPPPLLRMFQMVRSGPVSWFSPSTAYRPALPAPEGAERRSIRNGVRAPSGAECDCRNDRSMNTEGVSEEARSAGWWGSFEGWPCATPPCEERGAQHDATSTS